MTDWESLILERAKKRDQPSMSDLLELYGSYTELKHTFISTQLYNSIAARSADPEQPDGTLDALQQVQFLQGKLSQLQKKLTNSYRNKLNLEDSISQLSEKIEKLERELSEKDKTISRLERTVAHLKSEKA
ncbi:hypothetical protein OIY81_2858 [Cryptosporidium canis]|nr:hypothetical protein OIY81_2858 [Cryptosporidium canis]